MSIWQDEQERRRNDRRLTIECEADDAREDARCLRKLLVAVALCGASPLWVPLLVRALTRLTGGGE